jgi:hypothetical protein
LVATGDNAADRNNPDHNASHKTTTPGDKGSSRDSGNENRVEKARRNENRVEKAIAIVWWILRITIS